MKSVYFGSGSERDRPASDFVIPQLGAEELRVLGCLIEKEFFTPDVYPMTLNSLVTACNQKTSREPVVSYDVLTVDAVLVMLQGKGLAQKYSGPDHRVPKFKELLGERTGLRVSEIAVLCAMMLMPGRRSRSGGEKSSPRSILINMASASESTINATVEMA